MLKGFALIFALIFVSMGVVGFIPSLTYSPLLFNLFQVEPVHTIFYLLTGLFALSASASAVYAKLYFKILGIIFAFIAILGFALNGNLGFLHVDIADSFFHLVIAIIALYLGYTSRVSVSSHSHSI